MRIVKQLTNHRFLNIKEVSDPALAVTAYQFAERKGVDSVALIGYDKSTNRFLLTNEATPPTGNFMVRAFGGSIDKDKSYEEIAKGEMLEEGGYEVPLSNVKSLGRVFVSTQMNQYCYLFIVMLADKYKTERSPENETEALANCVWMTEDEIFDGEDWKSISIITKAKKMNLLKG